jgi:hypothetical protein
VNPDRYLLDTSALLTFIEDEEGADRVEQILRIEGDNSVADGRAYPVDCRSSEGYASCILPTGINCVFLNTVKDALSPLRCTQGKL